MYTFAPLVPEQNARLLLGNIRRWDTKGTAVIGKQYFVRQATISVFDRQGNQGPQNVRRSDG